MMQASLNLDVMEEQQTHVEMGYFQFPNSKQMQSLSQCFPVCLGPSLSERGAVMAANAGPQTPPGPSKQKEG